MAVTTEILKHLYAKKTQSIAELSYKLSKSTPVITKDINSLLQEGVVMENGFTASTGGRRAVNYSISDKLPYLILSVTSDQHFTSVQVSDLSDGIFYQKNSISLDLYQPKAGKILVDEIQKAIAEIPSSHQVIGIGISMPGFVNKLKGINESFKSKEPLYHIKDIVEQTFKIPTIIENDSRCIAMAEQQEHHLDDSNTLIINLNWGIGLGIIINGELFEGATGFAGEFSHIPIVDSNELCFCGKRGCLQVESSLMKAVERIQQAVENGENTNFFELAKEHNNKIQALAEACKMGDPVSINSLSSIGYYLGKGIAILIHILNPHNIILSGRGAQCAPFLMPHIQQAIQEYGIPKISSQTKIKISSLKEHAQQKGTVNMTIHNFIDNITKLN